MATGFESTFADQVLLPVALALVMFGMGMSLTTTDFRRVRARPRAVLVGTVTQVVGMPLLGAVVATVFFVFGGLSRDLALGLVLLACCPGGATSNLVAYLARADAALSVTLTSVSSVLAAITTPAAFLGATWLLFGDASLVRVSFREMTGLVLAIVVVPVVLGLAARHRWPALAVRSERAVRAGSIAVLAAVIVGVVVKNREDLVDLTAAIAPPAIALNLLALATGFLVARRAGLDGRAARTTAIEIAFQNGTLGIAIAITQLDSPRAAMVPGLYSLVMFATGAIVAWRWARHPVVESVAVRALARDGAAEATTFEPPRR